MLGHSHHFKLIPLLVFILVGSLGSSGWVMCVRADGHVILRPANVLNEKCCKQPCRSAVNARIPSPVPEMATDFKCSKAKPCIVIPWALMVATRAPDTSQGSWFEAALAPCASFSSAPRTVESGLLFSRHGPLTKEPLSIPEHIGFTILLI